MYFTLHVSFFYVCAETQFMHATWQVSFIHVTWCIHVRDLSRTTWQVSFIHVHTCDMMYSCSWQVSCISVCGDMIHVCFMTHSCMCAPGDIYSKCQRLPHICDMSRAYMWHDTFMYVKSLVHICVRRHDSSIWHDSSIYVCTRWHLLHMSNTHSNVWHVSFIHVTSRNIPDMSHSLMCAATWFMYVTWLIHLSVHQVTFAPNANDSLIYVTYLVHTCNVTHRTCDTSHAYICAATWFMYVTWLIHICVQQMTFAQNTNGPLLNAFMCVVLHMHTCDMTH